MHHFPYALLLAGFVYCLCFPFLNFAPHWCKLLQQLLGALFSFWLPSCEFILVEINSIFWKLSINIFYTYQILTAFIFFRNLECISKYLLSFLYGHLLYLWHYFNLVHHHTKFVFLIWFFVFSLHSYHGITSCCYLKCCLLLFLLDSSCLNPLFTMTKEYETSYIRHILQFWTSRWSSPNSQDLVRTWKALLLYRHFAVVFPRGQSSVLTCKRKQ